MSDPARPGNNDELVSSVRNLVANDAAGQGRKMPSLDRLMLTPALRVDEGDSSDDAVAMPASEADIADLATLDGADLAPTDLETRIAQDVMLRDIGGQIDDAALRDVVLQVLREELAGDMGERITRNVRKLVRREINRVLASRDLD